MQVPDPPQVAQNAGLRSWGCPISMSRPSAGGVSRHAGGPCAYNENRMTTAYLPIEETPSREDLARMPGPVVLEFGTDWCGICRALAPKVAELTARYPQVRHLKVE